MEKLMGMQCRECPLMLSPSPQAPFPNGIMAAPSNQQGSGRSVPPSARYPPSVGYAFAQDLPHQEDVVLALPDNPWPTERSQSESANGASSQTASSRFSPTSTSGAGARAVSSPNSGTASFGLYCLFKGHGGPNAARYAAKHLLATLRPLLPLGGPPPEVAREEYKNWREDLQQALTLALTMLHRSFAVLGLAGGCEATVILQSDWLLTLANLGNSHVVVDTGRQLVQVTVEDTAQRRVGGFPRDRGAASPIALPVVSQVVVPTSGARILLATKNMWSSCEKLSRPSNTIRSWATNACPARILEASAPPSGRRTQLDRSVMVLDLLPPTKQTFAEVAGILPAWRRVLGIKSKSSKEASANPVRPVTVLTQIDLAVVAMVIPGTLIDPPPWYTVGINQALLDAMEQAMVIWQEGNAQERSSDSDEEEEEEVAPDELEAPPMPKWSVNLPVPTNARTSFDSLRKAALVMRDSKQRMSLNLARGTYFCDLSGPQTPTGGGAAAFQPSPLDSARSSLDNMMAAVGMGARKGISAARRASTDVRSSFGEMFAGRAARSSGSAFSPINSFAQAQRTPRLSMSASRPTPLSTVHEPAGGSPIGSVDLQRASSPPAWPVSPKAAAGADGSSNGGHTAVRASPPPVSGFKDTFLAATPTLAEKPERGAGLAHAMPHPGGRAVYEGHRTWCSVSEADGGAFKEAVLARKHNLAWLEKAEERLSYEKSAPTAFPSSFDANRASFESNATSEGSCLEFEVSAPAEAEPPQLTYVRTPSKRSMSLDVHRSTFMSHTSGDASPIEVYG